ncbi:MAG: PaaI family thioesterase [Pseudomonadota bacterium]
MEQLDITVPEGFEVLPEGLGFTDNLQPCYIRATEDGVSAGLGVQPHHGNTMGICHGGVLMTLADIGAASALNRARGLISGAPTVNLSVDFINAARVGEWIQTESQSITIKRRFGFSSGVILGNKGIIARYNGTFYLPDHDGIYTEHATHKTALGDIAT